MKKEKTFGDILKEGEYIFLFSVTSYEIYRLDYISHSIEKNDNINQERIYKIRFEGIQFKGERFSGAGKITISFNSTNGELDKNTLQQKFGDDEIFLSTTKDVMDECCIKIIEGKLKSCREKAGLLLPRKDKIKDFIDE